MTDLQELQLPGGGVLEYAVSGPAGAPALVFHHGTPSSALQPRFLALAAHARGLRLVTFSRPGYARSTRQAGRRVADVASTTAALLDAIGVQRALVAGLSGGGPHALACAAQLPERFAAALVISGAAPYGAPGLDFMAGMGEDNVTEFSAATAGESSLRRLLEEQAPQLRTVTPEQFIKSMDSLLPDVDRACLSGELGEDLAASMPHAASGTVDGWLDDDLALVTPWGFNLQTIRIPVTLWQGGADLMVPPAHGRWLAGHVPGVHAHLDPVEGHISIAVGAVDRMLDELIALAD